MQVLITGSNGFLAKNLIEHIKSSDQDIEILSIGRQNSEEELKTGVLSADFIFHLAGVNRSDKAQDFINGNTSLTKTITNTLIDNNKTTPILFSSTTQVGLDNDYALSKESAEKHLEMYKEHTGANVFIYRLTNIFGKWSKPNYNSVVSTWCYNISRDLPVENNAPGKVLKLTYVDNVISDFLEHIQDNVVNNSEKVFYEASVTHEISLQELEETIKKFKNSRKNLDVTELGNSFTKYLYSTYLSYLPTNRFSYPLKENTDTRGSFVEFIRTETSGQVSISTSKPGVTRGNHYHHTKNEKFLVIKGSALIQFRKLNSSEIIEYSVTGESKEVIDIPTGYTHNITNTGDDEMILLLWANEAFDPQRPDTYFLKV